jgi:hypothetical protein
MCSVSTSHQFSHYTGINLLEQIFWSLQTCPLTCEVETKEPMRCLVQQTQHSSKRWHPLLMQVPHCQLAGFRVPHPYIECRHSYWLEPTKVMPSYVMHFSIWKPSAPGSTSNWMDPSGTVLWWQELPYAQISSTKPHKRIPGSATYSSHILWAS